MECKAELGQTQRTGLTVKFYKKDDLPPMVYFPLDYNRKQMLRIKDTYGITINVQTQNE